MKKKNLLGLMFLFSVIMLQSCTKEEDALTDDRDKLVGSWSVVSSGSISGNLTYTLEISKGSSSNTQIVMKNFDKQGSATSLFAEVSGNSISFNGVVSSSTINGTGTYGNSKITFNYTSNDGVDNDVVTATATQ